MFEQSFYQPVTSSIAGPSLHETSFRRGYEFELKGAYVLVAEKYLGEHGYVFGKIYKEGKKIFDIQVDNGAPKNRTRIKGYKWKILELVSTPSPFADKPDQSWSRQDLCMTTEQIIEAYSNIPHDSFVPALPVLKEKLTEFGLELRFDSGEALWRPAIPISITTIGLHVTVDFIPHDRFNNFMNNLVGTADQFIPEDWTTFLGLDKEKHKKCIKYHQLVWNFVNECLSSYEKNWGEGDLNLARVILFTLISDQVNPVYLKKLGKKVNNGKDVYDIIIKNNLKGLYKLIDRGNQNEFLGIIRRLSSDEGGKSIKKLIFTIVINLLEKGVDLYNKIKVGLTKLGQENFPQDGSILDQISWIARELDDQESMVPMIEDSDIIYTTLIDLLEGVNLYDKIKDDLTELGREKFPRDGSIPEQIRWIVGELGALESMIEDSDMIQNADSIRTTVRDLLIRKGGISLYDKIEDCLTELGKRNFPQDRSIPEQIRWIERELADSDTENITGNVFGAYGIQFFEDGAKEGGRDYNIFEVFKDVVNQEKFKGIGFAESLNGLLGGQGDSIPIVAELRFCKGIRCRRLQKGQLLDVLKDHLSSIEAHIERWMNITTTTND